MPFAIRSIRGTTAASATLAVVALFMTLDAHAADPASVPMSSGRRFTETDGESIYRASCQGCHMADGKGATGAATYPALAGNARLASSAYIAVTVLRGRKSMPAFGRALTDEQVAEVVRYVRTHLGNDYSLPLSTADVKAMR